MARKSRIATGKYRENMDAIVEGYHGADAQPMIAPLPEFFLSFDGPAQEQPAMSWARVDCRPPTPHGLRQFPDMTVTVYPNLRRRADPSIWTYVFARIRLHIVLNHMEPARDDPAWHRACWVQAETFIAGAGIGERPGEMPFPPTDLPDSDPETLAAHLVDGNVPEFVDDLSLAAPGEPFWRCDEPFTVSDGLRQERERQFAEGLRAAATQAVRALRQAHAARSGNPDEVTVFREAKEWVIGNFPLLSSLASAFALVENAEVCDRLQVGVAAISDEAREIYVHPRAAAMLDLEEAKFVMAHEFLHAGLRHPPRRQGRDPWLWNIACDYVINAWLIEMELGQPPERLGYLYDSELAGESAEAVYDRIVGDLRWMRKSRKARTLNGRSPDMLDGDHGPGWWAGGGQDLDAFYRRALNEGLESHMNKGRGTLPAGLIEEIRALTQPPIPWDVALAHWLDQFFPPLERRRSYARAHRRQSATPDIPRPAWIAPEEERAARVFGAVLDTSGSMDRVALGKAVGAIASYALSRDVGFIRLIQCDARAHDGGWILPDDLLDRVEVRGRGGTVLMPGIRMLETAPDFPGDGPVLVVTDGDCDTLTPRHEHAYLLASGGRLPFRPKGPVFHLA